MRVCLISPLTIGLSPAEASEVPYGDAPLGVLTLAAVAGNCGHEVRFADLDYLSHQLGPEQFLDRAASWIVGSGADVFGFGTICDSYPLTLRLARAVKRRCPEARIVLGGPQATVTAAEALAAFPEVDVVVRGEAEQTFPLLLDAFTSNTDLASIPGLTFRGPFGPCKTADAPLLLDLDEIPDPAWDLDPVFAERPDASVEIGRGCPFACDFCSTNDFFRRKYRMKSPARVLGQMAELERRYGFRKFSLVHDMFTVDRRRVLEFCDAAERLGAPYEWGCSARTDCVDEPLLDRMVAAGCRKLFFGVETGSARLQKSMGKGLDLDHARRMIAAADARGIRVTVSLITGFPDETEADLRDTAGLFLFASRFGGADVQLHLLNALAGTPITTRHASAASLELSEDAWSGDPAELVLIQRFPALFVNFYSLPTLLPRPFLHHLQLFLRCGRLRLNWLLQALHLESAHIVDVFLRFHDPAEGRTSHWYRSGGFPRAFLTFVQNENHPASRVLIGFYGELARLHQPPKSGHPALPPGAALVHSRGDVLGIVDAIRAGRSLAAVWDRPSAWIVVRAEEDLTGEFQQLSHLAGSVLQWCDGQRTPAEIGREAKRHGLAPEGLADAVVADVLLSRLHAEGLLVL